MLQHNMLFVPHSFYFGRWFNCMAYYVEFDCRRNYTVLQRISGMMYSKFSVSAHHIHIYTIKLWEWNYLYACMQAGFIYKISRSIKMIKRCRLPNILFEGYHKISLTFSKSFSSLNIPIVVGYLSPKCDQS